jgi:predicted ATP-grasp superfamily ATP-dependent carboligase
VSALAIIAIVLGAVVIAAAVALFSTRAGIRAETRAEDTVWLRDQRLRAYLILLAAAHEVAQPEKEHTLEDNRAAWEAVDAVEVLGPPDVARAARDLYEAAAEIMRYAVTKGMGELDTDKVVAMADAYQRQRRQFVEQTRATLT